MNRLNLRTKLRDGFLVRHQATPEAVSALAKLLPDPDVPLLAGVTCKPGSRTHGALVELDGRRYFLKRYNYRGRLYALQNAVRRSRAVYTWQLAWSFLERAVPIPAPLLCLEERRWRLLGRSYVLMEEVHGERLTDIWPKLGIPDKMVLLQELGGILGKMHRRGCLHGDLKWGNILVESGNESFRVRFVDLDGSRLLPLPVRWLARRDLSRFAEDLAGVEPDADWQQTLRRAWCDGWDRGACND